MEPIIAQGHHTPARFGGSAPKKPKFREQTLQVGRGPRLELSLLWHPFRRIPNNRCPSQTTGHLPEGGEGEQKQVQVREGERGDGHYRSRERGRPTMAMKNINKFKQVSLSPSRRPTGLISVTVDGREGILVPPPRRLTSRAVGKGSQDRGNRTIQRARARNGNAAGR